METRVLPFSFTADCVPALKKCRQPSAKLIFHGSRLSKKELPVLSKRWIHHFSLTAGNSFG
jgi:hypothetical protein